MNYTIIKFKNFFEKNLFFLILLSLISVYIRGYNPLQSNHSFYIPFIDKMCNNTLFQNDPIFIFEYNNTFFYYILCFFTKFLDLNKTFFFGYLLFSFLYIFAIYKLADYLFKNIFISYLSIILLIIPKPSLAGDATFYTTFYYNIISISLLLFSIYFFLKEKFFLSFSLVGVAFLIHALSAMHVILLYSLYFIFEVFEYLYYVFKKIPNKKYYFFNKKFLKNRIKSIIISYIVFILIALPLLIYKFNSEKESIIVSEPRWLEIQKIRNAYHIFPTIMFINIFLTLPLFALGIISFIHKNNLYKKILFDDKHKKILFLFIGFIFFLFIGTIFTELIPLKIIIQLQLLRSTNFLIILLIIYIANFLYDLFLKQKFLLFSAVFSGISLYNPFFILIFLPLASKEIIIFMKKIFLRKPIDYKKISLLLSFLTIVLLIFGLSLFFLQKLNYFKQNYNLLRIETLLFFVITLFFILFICKYFRSLFNKKNFFIILLIYSLIFLFIVSTIQKSKNMNNENIEWIDVQKWAFENTSKQSIFLTPTYLNGFRIYSKRPIYGDWKDGTLAFFSTKFAYEWFDRMNNLGINKTDSKFQKQIYNNLSENKILNLSKKYNISYVIFEDIEKNFTLIYKNNKFNVYKISNTS